MADEQKGSVHSMSDGGVTGVHEPADPFEFLAGPSTADEFNTARLRLIPIACFRIDDVRFKFDSSFILPEVQEEMSAFSSLRKSDPKVDGAPISIFGHADPSFQGNFELGSSTKQSGDDYNKVLSGRRAIAIYALLVRDPSFWNTLFSNHLGGDVWGEDSIRIMLDRLDQEGGSGAQQGQSQNSSSGTSSQSSSDSASNARVRDIAHDSGQRQQLFLKYMNLLCGDLKLDKASDFLARGAGPNQKGDVQGCSRFNPRLLFSQEKEAQFKTADHDKDHTLAATRNADNASNRRVLILVFRKGSQVLPSKWPCPTFKEGAAGCKKRFFSDGDQRRSTHTSGADRKFDETKDTYACRFFQRISDKSPCDQFVDYLPLRILLIDDRFLDGKDQSFDGLQYQLDVMKFHFQGQATGGIIEHLIPVTATQGTLTLLSESKDGKKTIFWKLNLEIVPQLGDSSSIEGAQTRLNNLGFFAGEQITAQADDRTERALQRFQTFYKVKDQNGKVETSGILTGLTSDKLKEVYGS